MLFAKRLSLVFFAHGGGWPGNKPLKPPETESDVTGLVVLRNLAFIPPFSSIINLAHAPEGRGALSLKE